MSGGQNEKTLARRAFFDEHARELVDKAVSRSLPAWSVRPRKLSAQFAFFVDDEMLAIVGWQGDGDGVNEALAWGLALACDRDVALVLPAASARVTLQRLPWVSAPVKVWLHEADAPGQTSTLPAGESRTDRAQTARTADKCAGFVPTGTSSA